MHILHAYVCMHVNSFNVLLVQLHACIGTDRQLGVLMSLPGSGVEPKLGMFSSWRRIVIITALHTQHCLCFMWTPDIKYTYPP